MKKETSYEELENFVEIEEPLFEKLLENYEITIVSKDKENNTLELDISQIEEDDFEDFADEVASYHEEPNAFWQLLKHNWHTNRTVTVSLYTIELPKELTI